MIAKLVESGPQDRKEISISKEEFLIGRGSDCDLRLGSSEISRHHCMLRFRGAEATIIDLGSINGTYLNGHRVRSQAPLHTGDQLRLASFTFVVEIDNEDGITWFKDPGADPNANTLKLNDLKRATSSDAAENPSDQPPGEASGFAGPGEKESE